MKIILFDFDGVIVDTYKFCYRIINSRDNLSETEYRARFEGNVNNTPKQKMTVNKSTNPFDFVGQYTSELMPCKPNLDLAKVIKKLATNHTLIIISSTVSSAISEYLKLHNLSQYFTEILGNDIEKSKVKKIQDVLSRYDILPTNTVLITDTLGDIKEARECGVQSIAVTWGYHELRTLQKGNPYKIISNPSEIIDVINAL
ncbi:HAD hydrolase-like protein [Patescibacteria group bacterium]|nr:HAD hydrolase-like protein [Patescibacteria group bacterium]